MVSLYCYNTVTSEMMCASMNQVVNRTLQLEGFSGSCEVSDNCTMTDCSLMAAFPPLPSQFMRSRVTYNPCDTPYSFHVVTSVPVFGIAVDEVISESKMVEFTIGESTGQINFNIVQGCHEITISVSCTADTFQTNTRMYLILLKADKLYHNGNCKRRSIGTALFLAL